MKIHHCILLAVAIATCLVVLAQTTSRSPQAAQGEPVVSIPWGGSS